MWLVRDSMDSIRWMSALECAHALLFPHDTKVLWEVSLGTFFVRNASSPPQAALMSYYLDKAVAKQMECPFFLGFKVSMRTESGAADEHRGDQAGDVAPVHHHVVLVCPCLDVCDVYVDLAVLLDGAKPCVCQGGLDGLSVHSADGLGLMGQCTMDCGGGALVRQGQREDDAALCWAHEYPQMPSTPTWKAAHPKP